MSEHGKCGTDREEPGDSRRGVSATNPHKPSVRQVPTGQSNTGNNITRVPSLSQYFLTWDMLDLLNWILRKFMHDSIVVLIVLQWVRSHLLDAKQPKFTESGTSLVLFWFHKQLTILIEIECLVSEDLIVCSFSTGIAEKKSVNCFVIFWHFAPKWRYRNYLSSHFELLRHSIRQRSLFAISDLHWKLQLFLFTWDNY